MVRGENEDAPGGILQLMLQNDNILSLTVQTMTYTGQGGGGFARSRHIPVDEAARIVCAESDGTIEFDDFVTRPSAHPLCYLVCYLLRSESELIPFARLSPRERVTQLLEDSYLIRPGHQEGFFRDVINELYAEGKTEYLGVLRELVERLYPTGMNSTCACPSWR
jgi:hypothetical protein